MLNWVSDAEGKEVVPRDRENRIPTTAGVGSSLYTYSRVDGHNEEGM